ncbi:MAG: GGDEF domain-containing protein [Eubacteriales bacterium]|nr:GGDEF domain-containing protein [Eubacteriales bacterium]
MKKQAMHYIVVMLCILAYLIMAYFLRNYASTGNQGGFLNLKEASVVRGILTQLQMLISVFLVLKKEKGTYVIAMLLNCFSLVSSLLFMIHYKSTDSLPGIISYLGVMGIISLMNFYKLKVAKQFKMLKENELQLEKMAFQDTLTDALNRNAFLKELDKSLKNHRKTGNKLAMIYLDVDDFKLINDVYGHYAGDLILETMVKRIKRVLRKEDRIGRLGGDEIGIFLVNITDSGKLSTYIREIQLVIQQPFEVDGKSLNQTVSIGVAVYPEVADSPDALLKRADDAMYQAKREGKNRISFFPSAKPIPAEEFENYSERKE